MLKRLALCLSLGLIPGQAHAWGKLGHKVVALLAERRLTPKAAKKVDELLGAKTSLADIAGCADDIKRKPIRCGSFMLPADHYSSGYHFINIPIDASPSKTALRVYCRNHGRDDGCSVAQIKEDLKTLGDDGADRRDRQIALMFVVHLVGDVHQPLHDADDGDSGGNAKLVRFLQSARAKKPTNLHHIWDDVLLRDSDVRKTSPEQLAAELERDLARKNWSAWLSGDGIDDAALEAFAIAKDKIYPAYYELRGSFGADYQREMQPIALEQVEKAGVRLAHLLNAALDPKVADARRVGTVAGR